MDVRIFLRVLWRFKWLVLGGAVLGIVVAVVAYSSTAPVPTWQSQSEVLITAASDPYGRAVEQYTDPGAKTSVPAAPIGDQTYMEGLAPIYATLANGIAAQALIHKTARVPGAVRASEVDDEAADSVLPFVQLTATAPSSRDATTLANKAASAVASYVGGQQRTAAVPAAERVQLVVVQPGSSATLISSHKVSIPILVFVAIFGAAIVLALLLENASPRTTPTLAGVPFITDGNSRAQTDVVSVNHESAVAHGPDIRAPEVPKPVRDMDPAADQYADGYHQDVIQRLGVWVAGRDVAAEKRHRLRSDSDD
jgi:hypothetical protein